MIDNRFGLVRLGGGESVGLVSLRSCCRGARVVYVDDGAVNWFLLSCAVSR